jgi:pyruvate-ferredoxin/flavodoxin oxidoreductase
VAASLEEEFASRSAALRAEYEQKLSDLRASYPAQMARQLATALLSKAGGSAAVAELLAELPAANGSAVAAAPAAAPAAAKAAAPAAASPAPPPAPAAAAPAPAPSQAAEADEDGGMVLEAYIDSERCTSCDECTNISKKVFAYNADKQAYIKDAAAGTFKQLVTAAERCPVSIIHPGTPLNPKEKDLDKWIARAAKFN